MYFAPYTSVRRQVADKGVRTVLSQQQRRGREQQPRHLGRVGQALEAARAADAQAAMLRKARNGRAKLQPPEAESRAKIPAREGLNREGVLWEAAWAKRRLEVSI